MIKALTEELQNKLIELKDKWIEDVLLNHAPIEDSDKLKSLSIDELENIKVECEIEFAWEDDKYIVYKNNEPIAEYSRKYHIEECEDGLKIKIESWIN